jgi:hypothetical protein
MECHPFEAEVVDQFHETNRFKLSDLMFGGFEGDCARAPPSPAASAADPMTVLRSKARRVMSESRCIVVLLDLLEPCPAERISQLALVQ